MIVKIEGRGLLGSVVGMVPEMPDRVRKRVLRLSDKLPKLRLAILVRL